MSFDFDEDIRKRVRQHVDDVRRKARRVAVGIGGLLVLALVLAAAGTCFYTVQADEQAVVLRFGKYLQTTEPGLHFRLPLGIDRVHKVSTRKIHKLEFGYTTVEPDVRTEYARTSEDRLQAVMLTGDLNIADVEWIVQYRISDPRAWVLEWGDMARERTIVDMSESITRRVIGNHMVNEVLTTRRDVIGEVIERRLQEQLDSLGMGVDINTVKLQTVNPPEPVQAAFNDVNQAQQEKERLENEARRTYNTTIPEAKGSALQVVEEAEGYAIERTNRAKGDVARFNRLLPVYRSGPEVTRTRLYLETLEEVLPAVERVIVVDEGGGVLKLLDLDKRLPEGGGR